MQFLSFKNICSFLIVAFLVSFAVSASAEIYFVDIQKVLAESSAGKSAKKALDSKFTPTKSKLEKDREALVKMQADIRSQSALLSADAMNKKVGEFREKEKAAAQAMQQYQRDFTTENNKKLEVIVKEMRNILEGLAKDLGAKVILEKSPQLVLYLDDDYDVTDKVIKELNNKNIKF